MKEKRQDIQKMVEEIEIRKQIMEHFESGYTDERVRRDVKNIGNYLQGEKNWEKFYKLYYSYQIQHHSALVRGAKAATYALTEAGYCSAVLAGAAGITAFVEWVGSGSITDTEPYLRLLAAAGIPLGAGAAYGAIRGI